MPETKTVRLGDHLLPVVPQRHARLRHRLSAKDIEGIFGGDYGQESYRVLGVLIPAMLPENGSGIPLWEWMGFGSQEAMDADDYQEDLDKSPTTAEIIAAFEMSLQVSGADRLGKLLELVTTTTQMTGMPTQN